MGPIGRWGERPAASLIGRVVGGMTFLVRDLGGHLDRRSNSNVLGPPALTSAVRVVRELYFSGTGSFGGGGESPGSAPAAWGAAEAAVIDTR